MQTKEELEHWYAVADPWLYKLTPDDEIRKNLILDFLPLNYQRALDIGCGEGFVTTDLPAIEIHGIEISDNAARRLPWNVKRVHSPEGLYDLVMTTGTLYQQYDHVQIYNWIKQSACRHILVAGNNEHLIDYDFGKIINQKEFTYRQYYIADLHTYRQYIQRVTLYEVGA